MTFHQQWVMCHIFDMSWISMMRRQLLFRQFRDKARLPVYCLHTKISFKQTNKHPRESSYLNHNDLLYKGKPKFYSEYSDFSCLWDAKLFNLFVVNLTQLSNRQTWSGVLHISFFFIVLQERLYIMIFLNAYFHHWNLIRKY